MEDQELTEKIIGCAMKVHDRMNRIYRISNRRSPASMSGRARTADQEQSREISLLSSCASC
jgi:hypothetical protein